MGEKNIWERIRGSSNCRVLILNLILTLCLNLLLEFTERRSVSEVFSFVQERTFVFLYNGFIIFLFRLICNSISTFIHSIRE